ncbi:uncharacterized protein LOC144829388 isoform X4 [Lissotriton helveticus]
MGFVIVATEASRTMLRDSKIRQVSPQDRKGRFAALVSPRKPCRSWITAETLLALGRCLEDCRGTHRTGAAPEIRSFLCCVSLITTITNSIVAAQKGIRCPNCCPHQRCRRWDYYHHKHHNRWWPRI